MSLTSVNIRPQNAINVLDKNQGWISLIRHSGEEIDIVNAARVSFGKFRTEFSDTDKQLLDFLIKEKHFGPLEHITFSFLVHCPLFVRGQWHRHRCWSYNEISRRYTDVDLEFYIPYTFRTQSSDNKQASEDNVVIDSVKSLGLVSNIRDNVELLVKTYNDLISNGVCREQARSILPQNMMTTFYASTDLRNLLHFLSLRMDKHAQWEIRQYANAIHDMLVHIYPNVMKAFDEGLIK
jgi:thymidylate synthase (FAD)